VRKKIFLGAMMSLVILSILATPVLAATNIFGIFTDVEVKEPLVVSLAADTPIIPDVIWPGETIEWKFEVINISPNDYWVTADLRWISQDDFWVESTGVRLGSNTFNIYNPIRIPAGTSEVITVYAVIGEDNPLSERITFSPSIRRSVEPEQKG